MNDKLFELVSHICELSDSEYKDFASIWKPFSANRKEIITKTGEPEKYLYFVLSGVQRICFFDEDDHEATLIFTYPYSFAGVVDSMMLNLPSKFDFECIEDSTFLRARYKDLEELIDKNKGIANFIRKALAISLSGLLDRMVELQALSSEEKFRNLMKRSSHLLNLIPHKYLANYIGIDPTNFSKMVNRIKI